MSARSNSGFRLRRSIERHYDSLLHLYRFFWGEHIHHGLWSSPNDPPARAQERLVSHLAARAGVRSGALVLDVGCGYAASARWLAKRLSCRVVGVTISGRQARAARRLNAREAGTGSIAIVRGDAADPPFAADRFDVVWVIECSEHLEDKAAFMREVARMLAPGGSFALCAWLRAEGVPADEPRIRDVCEAFLCPSLASGSEFTAYCEEAGLEVETLEDLTDRVRPTWGILRRRVSRPWLVPLRLLLGRETRRFLNGFRTIDEAFGFGTMRYALLVARRAF